MFNGAADLPRQGESSANMIVATATERSFIVGMLLFVSFLTVFLFLYEMCSLFKLRKTSSKSFTQFLGEFLLKNKEYILFRN